MRLRRRLAVLAALVGGSLLAVASAAAPASSTPARTGPAWRAAPRELIYVANAAPGPVTAYLPGSKGAVIRVRAVLARDDPNAFWDPWALTFDSSGHLYVQSFGSDATTFVFAPGAHGVTKPQRDFMGIGPDNRGIAVDSHGYEYVSGGNQPTTIVVERPGAAGLGSNLYFVPPVRSFQPGEAWNPWPSDLAIDSHNELLAVNAGLPRNAIDVFAGGAHGSDRPLRVISGPATGLGSCDLINVGPCDQLVIAYSNRTHEIYVGVTAGSHSRILVFAGNAAGNVKPLHTIEGPATGLAGMSMTGITSSQCDGTIYAVVHAGSTGFGPGRIVAYGRSERGNSRPLRSFTDRSSRFRSAEGLTVTACAAR